MNVPAQDASNTVLFEMMMFYKRKMEIAEETAAQDRKRLKIEQAAAHDARDSLEAAHINIRILEDANRRGSAIIMRKHHAGMLMADAFEGLLSCIEIAKNGDRGKQANNSDVKYIVERAEEQAVIFDVAVSQFTTGWLAPDDEVELQTEEVIDLTGEETEEEDVGEWV